MFNLSRTGVLKNCCNISAFQAGILVILIYSFTSCFLYGDEFCTVNGSLRKSLKTMDKGVGPFTPEELGGCSPLPLDESPPCISCERDGYASPERIRALRDIGIHCGRCHRWATDSHLILREKKKIVPIIKSGHGQQGLSDKRKAFLLEAFNKGDEKL
jgi:hypothetical protein